MPTKEEAIHLTKLMIIETRGELNLLRCRLSAEINRMATTRKRIKSTQNRIADLATILNNQCKKEYPVLDLKFDKKHEMAISEIINS